MLTCKRCKYTNELLFVRVQSRMLSTFLLHLRFGFSWSLCVYTNYIYLLTYLSLYNPDPIWQNREKQELIYTSNKLLLSTLGKQLPSTTLVLSGFEGLLKRVGLEMMAEGVRAGTHSDGWRETERDCRMYNGSRTKWNRRANDGRTDLLGALSLRLASSLLFASPVRLVLDGERADHLVDGEPARVLRAAVEHLRIASGRHEPVWSTRPHVAVVRIVDVDFDDDLARRVERTGRQQRQSRRTVRRPVLHETRRSLWRTAASCAVFPPNWASSRSSPRENSACRVLRAHPCAHVTR